jgi:hypothetical protein
MNMEIPPSIGGFSIPPEGNEPAKTETPALRKEVMATEPPETSKATMENIPSQDHKIGFILLKAFGTGNAEPSEEMIDGTALTVLDNLKTAFRQIPD